MLHADPISKVHLNLLASFCNSVQSFHVDCVPIFGTASVQLLSLICTSCCILVIASVLLCGPSAAALTLNPFCPITKGKRATSQTSVCYALENISHLLLSFSFLLFFTSNHRKTFDELLALLPQFPSSALLLLLLLLLLLFLLFLSFLPLPFLPLFSNQPAFHLMASALIRVWVLALGPLPGCFFFSTFEHIPPFLSDSSGDSVVLKLLLRFAKRIGWGASLGEFASWNRTGSKTELAGKPSLPQPSAGGPVWRLAALRTCSSSTSSLPSSLPAMCTAVVGTSNLPLCRAWIHRMRRERSEETESKQQPLD